MCLNVLLEYLLQLLHQRTNTRVFVVSKLISIIAVTLVVRIEINTNVLTATIIVKTLVDVYQEEKMMKHQGVIANNLYRNTGLQHLVYGHTDE